MMTDYFDQVEQELRAASARIARGSQRRRAQPTRQSVTGFSLARLSPGRLRRSSTRAHVGMTLAAAACLSAMVAAALFVLGLGAGTQKAFAGWTTVPSTPGSGQTAEAEAACAQRMADFERTRRALTSEEGRLSAAGQTSNPTSSVNDQWQPTLADTRGPFTMMILQSADGKSEASCITEAASHGAFIAVTTSAGHASPSSGAVQPTFGGSTVVSLPGEGRKEVQEAVGDTGPGVTGVKLILADGTAVTASVGDDRFLAWWPGSVPVVSAEVTTASSTTMQRL